MTKRERTRQRLLECALDLFELNGFEATTVSQIATAAGVTPMTFFRHFAAKENVLLDDPYDPVIAAAVISQPRSLPALLRVTHGIRAAWAQLPEPESELVRRRVRVAALTPALRNAAGANSGQTERLITEALKSGGVAPLPARAAAAAAMAAVTAALFEWATEPTLTLADAVATVLNVLEGSV